LHYAFADSSLIIIRMRVYTSGVNRNPRSSYHHRPIQAEDKHPQHHELTLSFTRKAESRIVRDRKSELLSPHH